MHNTGLSCKQIERQLNINHAATRHLVQKHMIKSSVKEKAKNQEKLIYNSILWVKSVLNLAEKPVVHNFWNVCDNYLCIKHSIFPDFSAEKLRVIIYFLCIIYTPNFSA